MRNSLFVLLFSFVLVQCTPFKRYEEAAKSWEKDIQQLEKKDQIEKYSSEAILCLGSSSFRLWGNIKEDMAPYEMINRGYGGAKFTDLLFYTERLVAKHDAKAVLIFVANDITGTPDDRTPKEVLQLFKAVEKKIRQKHKNKPIVFIEITPTESRWKVWSQIKEVNTLIRTYCESKSNLHFIQTSPAFLNEEGEPKAELFIQDKLHLNAMGYHVWAEELKKGLKQAGI